MSDKTEITHELIKPFLYTPKNAGEQVEATFITLREPSVRNLTSCATLKQAFMRVIASAAEDSQGQNESSADTSDDDIEMAERIMNAMYTSDVDINTVLLSAKELFKDVALIEGEKKMTMPLLEELSIEDLEKMTGEYMSNFIVASVLKDQ